MCVCVCVCVWFRWCDQDLCPVVSRDSAGCYDPQTAAMDTALVYDGLLP